MAKSIKTKLSAVLKGFKEKMDKIIDEKDKEIARLVAQLQVKSEEYTANKAEHKAERVFTPEDFSEFETRKKYIDIDLKLLGWKFSQIDRKDCVEEEMPVVGMPKELGSGNGFVDYVLWGKDGTPIALIEAKRTCKDAKKGKHQAWLYANCIEQMSGHRPIMFNTNGYDCFVWDDKTGPQRPVSSVFSRDDLQRMFNRRFSRKKLSEIEIDDKITDRYYQKQAIRAVCDNIEKGHMRSLLAMATGTGKTRTSSSLTDVLSRGGYVTNTLFLADRTALVGQAKDDFDNYLPHMSLCNLLANKVDKDARIVFSTYPTILNAIDSTRNEDGSRFFTPAHFDLIIIDEAHNLVERARDMFSAQLNKRAFMELKNEIKGASALGYKALNKINKYFIQLKKQLQESNGSAVIELPTEILPLIETFVEEWNSFIAKNRYYITSDSMMDLFFACVSFIAVNRLYDTNYVTYAQTIDNDVRLKLFCINPAQLINKSCKKCRAAVFFSATLLPLDFFKAMLGGEDSDKCIRLASPFPRENLCLMAADNISTKYKDRNDTGLLVARYIKEAIESRTGNYMVFFPSFEYMRKVYQIYREVWPYDSTIIQDSSMKDAQRENFLEMFVENPQETLIAFAVMDGIFSEGIDLTGDRLSGAIVIGVGIPQICLERQIISDFFMELRDAGYEYAYMFPGMNRVLQAAGRIIRSETDRGFILLLDERFLQWRYQELFPPEWVGYARISSPEEVKSELEDFWLS